MDPETINWLRVGHVIGFVLWIAGLVAVLELLRVHAAVEGAAREVVARHQRAVAMVMDAGATLTMAFGLWRAFGSVPNKFKTGAWLHIKVTLVVLVLLGVHGYARVKMRKFRSGEVGPIPGWLVYLVLAVAVVVITLGANPDLLRKH